MAFQPKHNERIFTGRRRANMQKAVRILRRMLAEDSKRALPQKYFGPLEFTVAAQRTADYLALRVQNRYGQVPAAPDE
jgi:hypothetical protein